MIRFAMLSLATLILTVAAVSLAEDAPAPGNDGWITLFSGKDLAGWKISENPNSFKVVDGVLIVDGPRAHLFYVGDENDPASATFTNFEFHAKVLTKPKANSGIYFHTAFQPNGWPGKGYECQVNQTHGDRKKTGGLYAVKDVMDKSPVNDDEWHDYDIKVEGKHIVIKINGEVTCDFTEPEGWNGPGGMPGRKLSSGTFALQAHDPQSVIHYKDIRVKRLP